jgi:hypothetical protein
MAYIVTASVTFASQANRDAAITRVNSAIAAYNYINTATVFAAGISSPTSTTMTLSMESLESPGGLTNAIWTAITSTGRPTSGFISLNKTA